MSPAPRAGVSAGGLDTGDIVHLDFTPSAGHEMRGPHHALVISRRAFNQASGIAWVCPISQGEAAAQRAGGSSSPSWVPARKRSDPSRSIYCAA